MLLSIFLFCVYHFLTNLAAVFCLILMIIRDGRIIFPPRAARLIITPALTRDGPPMHAHGYVFPLIGFSWSAY